LPNSRPTPKEEIHLELLRALVNDGALDAVFLSLREGAPHTWTTPAQGWSACIEQVNAGANRGVAQARHGHDLHDTHRLFVQPHDLLAPLVALLQCLLSCVFFFHISWSQETQISSYFIGPYQ
jgi:hypothetical protein